MALVVCTTFNYGFSQTNNKSKKQKQTKMEQAKKELTKTFIIKGFNEKDSPTIDKVIANTYVQHNPGSGDGKDALKGMLQYISPKVEIIRSIAEGDLVVQHNKSTGWGDNKTYITFDIFRIINGKIVEHWDIMQTNVDKTVSGRTMTDGETKITDIDKTQANKKVVQGFLDECIYGNNWQNITKYVSTEKYLQHNPNVGDGLHGFNDAMKQMQEHSMTMKYEKTYRVIAEGNFVFVHSKGEFGGKQVAFADLMRIENGKIVEHWDAIQELPKESKNGHDMFEQVSK